MKKVLIATIFCTTLIFASCSSKEKNDCKQCNKCATKVSAEVCEDNFEKSSDYYDKIDDYLADGCECKDKD
ncbi:MAG: hypothetical protein COA97_04815 [Flavobacteriales bacterium]|nr:MAG: hypothetical protein COA97_04815 [Flavobacteriales bacterium]